MINAIQKDIDDMKKHKSIVSQKEKNIIKKKYFGEIKIDNVSAIQKL